MVKAPKTKTKTNEVYNESDTSGESVVNIKNINKPVNTIDRTGPCYVLSKNVGDMGLMGDIVSSKQLIDYMFKNSEELYFKDRKGYVVKMKSPAHPCNSPEARSASSF